MKRSDILKIEYFRDQFRAWRLSGSFELSKGKYWSWTMFKCILVYLLTPMILGAMFRSDKPLENNYNFIVSLTLLSNLLKFPIYVTQLPKLVEIQKLISQLDARVSGKDQELRHGKISKHMQRMSKLFLIIYVIIFINAAVPFVFEKERNLPVPMWFPLDWKNSSLAYMGALHFQEISMFFQILHTYAADSFSPLALILVSEQCQLLILRISQIGYGSRTLKENEQDLVECIRDQNTLYRLLELIGTMISYPLMVQFSTVGVSIAANLFGLIYYVETTSNRVYYFCYLLGLTMQIYPSCYYGSTLENSFAELHYAVFCSNWVGQSATYRGHMLIMEERTKRQQRLLAGKLVPIHLRTFVACLQGAFSFFTLMVNRSDPNREHLKLRQLK
nr:odorant receptor 23a-like [Drosophila takahashii]